jgi:hypothetical protein
MNDDELAIRGARNAIMCGEVKRRVLTIEELARLKEPRARFEKDIRLPGDSRRKSTVWMFAIDAELDGNVVRGALFKLDDEPECMIVQARTFPEACRLANDGLRSTIALLHHEVPLVTAHPEHAVEVFGRKARPFGDLRTDPKLKDLLGHKLGGKPWLH